MLDVLKIPQSSTTGGNSGGLLTLASYGVTPTMTPTAEEQVELIEKLRDAVPEEHLTFMENLPSSFTCGDFFFVHAGVRPGVPLDQQRDQDMFWIRMNFEIERGLRQIHRARPYAGEGTGYPAEPHQYRHRCLCDGQSDAADDPGRQHARDLAREESRSLHKPSAARVLRSKTISHVLRTAVAIAGRDCRCHGFYFHGMAWRESSAMVRDRTAAARSASHSGAPAATGLKSRRNT